MRERDIFIAALQHDDPAARRTHVEQECGADAGLRERVEALLGAFDRAGSFMLEPAAKLEATSDFDSAGPDPAMPTASSPVEGPGTVIGPYKLLEQIGEGGMGVVYAAEQAQPVRRKVALKIIKPGMDTRQVIARFEAERQALALMDHPNIARVLDAGATAAGRPYFVMELVKGVPITTYCDTVRQPAKDRLELFVAVCQAIQHAHQKGIIHRDIKPSNVLVAMVDGKPTPKVIDFGVVKAIDQRLTERTVFTQHGFVLGTLEYMSPEQAELSGLDIDTRTDIYALGVLLYELLTGTTPLTKEKVRQAAYSEVLRQIREEEPPRPSTRLSDSGDHLASLAALRRTEPARLTRQVRGELDWIVMKALDKDRTRRYETANGFARDIQHYLAGEPVEAGPPSAAYRLRKLARKHRAALATIGAFIALLVTATAVSSWLALRATRAERLARERLNRAMTAEADAKTQAALARTQQQRAEDREVQAIDAVRRYGDAITNEAALKNSPELEALRRRLLKEPLTFLRALRDRLQADRDTRPESLVRLANTGMALSDLSYAIGEEQDALAAQRETLAIWQRLADANPTATEFQRALWTSRNNIGILLRDTGRPDEAIKAYESALATAQALANANPTVIEFQRDLAATHSSMGLLLGGTGKTAEAMKAFEFALATLKKLADSDPTDTESRRLLANSHNNIGILLGKTGRPAEAMKAHLAALEIRQKLADTTRTTTEFQSDVTASYHNIAAQLTEAGKQAEALGVYKSALAIWQKLADANPSVTEFRSGMAGSHNGIGLLLNETRRPVEAMKAHESALAIRQVLADAEPSNTQFQRNLAASRVNIGMLLGDAGKPAEAIRAFESALTVYRKLVDANPTSIDFQNGVVTSYINLGAMLISDRRPAEAKKAFESALAIVAVLERRHPESPDLASNLGAILNNVALLDVDAGRIEEARVHLRRAVVAQKKALDMVPAHPTYRQFLDNHLSNLIEASRSLGDLEGVSEAERDLEKLRASDPAIVALDARLAVIVKGTQQPRGAADRVRLAQRAHEKKLFATAARLWGEALAADLGLGDDRQAQHRYNAACAAARAGTGQGGKDDPGPDEAARATLRTRALALLKEELAAWKRVALTVGPGNKELVAKTLIHWKSDADLAGIRDGKPLAELPGDEQATFRELWNEVDSLLRKVSGESAKTSNAGPSAN